MEDWRRGKIANNCQDEAEEMEVEKEKGRGKGNFEVLRGGETPPTPLLSAKPFYIDTKLIVQFRHPDMKLASNWQKIRLN